MSSAPHSEYTYRPAWWVPGAHAQTLWGKFFRRARVPDVKRVRWETPDNDFIDLYRLGGPAEAPRLFFLHGLEGTIRSHYVAGFFREAKRRRWSADLLIFRGCGDEPNRAARFYHSGETTDLAFAVERVIAESPDTPLLLAGVSLGGNVLLKYLGERGSRVPREVVAAATVSVPYDLERGARFIGAGFSRVYDRHFLRTLRRKALEKLERYPGLFDRRALDHARTLEEFDDAVTAPVHGFMNAHDYYSRSSGLRWLAAIRVPTLLLSARDDPFLPVSVLDDVQQMASQNPELSLEFTAHGGHAGFVSGTWPWQPCYYAEWRVCEFLASKLSSDGSISVAEAR